MPPRAHLYFTQTEAAAAFDTAVRDTGPDAFVHFHDAIERLDEFRGRTLLRCPADACPRHVLTDFMTARADSDAPVPLLSVVTTLDAGAVWRAMADGVRAAVPAVTVAAQIEHATAIVLTGWRELEVDTLRLLVAVLDHLNPGAALVLLGADATIGVDESTGLDRTAAVMGSPGWMHAVSGTFRARTVHDRVRTIRYENLRPFHPGRLAALFAEDTEAEIGRIVRSAGFCRLATRPREVALWDHCGPTLAFSPLPGDPAEFEPLAIGQDIAFTGIDLDADRLRRALDTCVLDDDELVAGAEAWLRLPDPLPRWDQYEL